MEKPTQNEINRMVQLQLGVNIISADNKLIQDLGAESADIANIVAAAEEKYHIDLQESEIAKIITPQDILELVLSKLNE
ncbi:MAG: phosphopantetheine-binding protein [Anaerolineales bacterium]|jgi:acyl carrier protein